MLKELSSERCPICGSGDVDSGSSDFPYLEATQEMYCSNCLTSFLNIDKLTRQIVLEKDKSYK